MKYDKWISFIIINELKTFFICRDFPVLLEKFDVFSSSKFFQGISQFFWKSRISLFSLCRSHTNPRYFCFCHWFVKFWSIFFPTPWWENLRWDVLRVLAEFTLKSRFTLTPEKIFWFSLANISNIFPRYHEAFLRDIFVFRYLTWEVLWWCHLYFIFYILYFI